MSSTHDDNWEKHWDSFADSASRNPAQSMRHSLIRCLLKGSEKMRLFDIGSGQGDMLAKLNEAYPGADFLGVELSAKGVELSRKKVPNATFLVADLYHPPVEMERFSKWATHAVCSEVLEHVDDPVAFLRAVRPYLSGNARLIVTVPGGPMSAFDRVIGHRRHFNRATLTDVLEQSGFTVHRVYRAGFPFFNLYRGVVISRGDKLASDVCKGRSSVFADLAMAAFSALFNLNLTDSPFGWQMVAVATKTSSE